jgi:hypothetical protein
VKTNLNPQELVVELLKRSTCSVQVAAVMEDDHGVHAWGWNSSGPDGLGQHAEAHCLSRANPARVPTSTLYIAARRRKSGHAVVARPCETCAPLAYKCHHICWRDKDGSWCWSHYPGGIGWRQSK